MSENLRYYLEKATKEFVYPTTQATPEEVEFVVVPMLEAVKDWLESRKSSISNSHVDSLVDVLLTDTAFQFISSEKQAESKQA
jgi:hypothetical protein